MAELTQRADRSWKAWGLRFAILVLTPPLLAVAYFGGQMVAGSFRAGRTTTASQPKIDQQVSGGIRVESGLDLGEIWEDREYVAQLTLVNTTNSPINIERFDTGCGCSRVEPSSLVISPTGQGIIRVHIDLTKRQPHQYGVERRELLLPISPHIASKGVVAQPWVLEGVVLSRISLDTHLLQFGDMGISGGLAVSKSVRCRIYQPGTTVVAASASKEMGSVTVLPVADGSNDVLIRVSPNPKIPVGPYQFEIPLTVQRPDGELEKGPVLSIEGEMRSVYQVSPSAILLGEHRVGETAEGEFALTLPPDSGCNIKQIGTDSPSTKVELIPSDSPGLRRYKVRQQVDKPSDQEARIRIVVVNGRGESETISVHLRWFGITKSPAYPK